MNYYGLQALQVIGMLVAPFAIGANSQSKETTAVWSCVVIALLFIGVSICAVANAIGARERGLR